MTWDAKTYDSRFGFVTRGGDSLIDLLDPQPGERILDLGCGTGDLTATIAERGATVVGLDADAHMIGRARERFPAIEFVQGDGHDFSLGQFDAVFSNAALHWLTRPRAVTTCVRGALGDGGRFVAEQGGAGNVAQTTAVLNAARVEAGAGALASPWYFPSVAEHATVLESTGFRVVAMFHFDRPSELADSPDGVGEWARVFGTMFFADLSSDAQSTFFASARRQSAPLQRPDGTTVLDYVRLRWRAEVAASTLAPSGDAEEL
jgi:trans-aconitate methyltransferase